VRDRIPELIAASGKTCTVRVLDDQEYVDKLHEKLAEELQEYLADGSVEELADLAELILAILDVKGVSPEEFEAIRRRKREERGGFSERLLLVHVSD